MFQVFCKTTQGLWNSFSLQHPNLLFSSIFYSKTNSLFGFSFLLFLLFSFFFSTYSHFVFSFLWDTLFELYFCTQLLLIFSTSSFLLLYFPFLPTFFFCLHNSRLQDPHTCFSQIHRTQRIWEVTIVVSLILGTRDG